MPTFYRALPAFALLALVAAVPAQAQDKPAPADLGGDSITIGAGGAYIPDYEGSNSYRFTPVPGAVGQYKGFSFLIAGNRASIDLIPNEPGTTWDLQAGPVAAIDFNRSTKSEIDDPRVKMLGLRHTSLEVGGYLGLGKTGVITSAYDKLSVSVSYRKGVTGSQRGGILEPSLTYITPVSRKAAVGLLASAERAERAYGAAYYDVGVSGSLASGLPVYRTQGGWKDWSVGGLATYSLTGDLLHGFKLVGGVTYSHILGSFADSPLVAIAGSKSQWLGAAGVAYTF